MTTPFIRSILATPLDGTIKGIPAVSGSVRLGDVGAMGWNVLRGDMVLPLLVLHDSHLCNNLELMRDFATHHGVSIAPHGKSSLCPQLYLQHVETLGAWGMSAATTQQATVIAESGIRNILIANQIVGRAAVAQLAGLIGAYPECNVCSLVDSEASLNELRLFGAALLRPGERFRVLVEIGVPGGRAGVRRFEDAIRLIDLIASQRDVFDLVGVECYEGAAHGGTPEETIQEVDRLLDLTIDVLLHARSAEAFSGRTEVILTAAGSTYPDRAVAKLQRAAGIAGLRIVLRGGSSLISDHGIYRTQLAQMDKRGGLDIGLAQRSSAVSAVKPALELLAAVLSVQEDGVAIMNMGIRDMPHDLGYPTPLRIYRDSALVRTIAEGDSSWRIVRSHDQHCFLAHPCGSGVAVGDVVAFGISHPCTAFDKWRIFYRVDEAFNVTGALKTFF
jgi:D-serine dehydratase